MARSRILKPEFWSDEKLATVPREARLTFAGLWTCSDDYGVTKGHPAWLKSQIFPYDVDLELAEFRRWLTVLEGIGVIVPFSADGESFYHIKHFCDHQRVDKPSKTRNPECPRDILARPSRVCRDSPAPDSEKSGDEVETEVEEETELKQKPKGGCGGKTEIRSPPLLDLFERFWRAYPRKRSKGKAERAFIKISPDEELLATMLAAIERASMSEDWLRKGGRFIPYPASWLAARGWEDEGNDLALDGHVSDTTLGNMKTMEEWRPPHDEREELPENDDHLG